MRLRRWQVWLRRGQVPRQEKRWVPVRASVQVRQRLVRVCNRQVTQRGDNTPAHHSPCGQPPQRLTRFLWAALWARADIPRSVQLVCSGLLSGPERIFLAAWKPKTDVAAFDHPGAPATPPAPSRRPRCRPRACSPWPRPPSRWAWSLAWRLPRSERVGMARQSQRTASAALPRLALPVQHATRRGCHLTTTHDERRVRKEVGVGSRVTCVDQSATPY